MRTIQRLLLSVVVALSGAGLAADKAKVAEARRLAVDARAAFNEGRFAESASLLERAYALEPKPALLYNMGRALQQAGARRQAIDAYQRYLRDEPDTPDAGAVRTTVRQLEDELEREQALEAAAVAERVRADREAADRARAVLEKSALEQRLTRRPAAWPWVVAGAGALSLGVGVLFGALASGRHQAALREPDALLAEQRQNEGGSFAIVANVSYLAGAVLALVGVGFGVLDLFLVRRDSAAAVSP